MMCLPFFVKTIFKSIFKRHTSIWIHCSLNWTGSDESDLGRYSVTQDYTGKAYKQRQREIQIFQFEYNIAGTSVDSVLRCMYLQCNDAC